jgi:hypothetical protein
MIHVSESATVAAPPAAVYELIADYVHGHPTILPPRYFEGVVERLIVPGYLRKVYREELGLIGRRA